MYVPSPTISAVNYSPESADFSVKPFGRTPFIRKSRIRRMGCANTGQSAFWSVKPFGASSGGHRPILGDRARRARALMPSNSSATYSVKPFGGGIRPMGALPQIIGGAATGASVGAAAGPYGAAAGAVIGGVLGLLGGNSAAKAQNAANWARESQTAAGGEQAAGQLNAQIASEVQQAVASLQSQAATGTNISLSILGLANDAITTGQSFFTNIANQMPNSSDALFGAGQHASTNAWQILGNTFLNALQTLGAPSSVVSIIQKYYAAGMSDAGGDLAAQLQGQLSSMASTSTAAGSVVAGSAISTSSPTVNASTYLGTTTNSNAWSVAQYQSEINAAQQQIYLFNASYTPFSIAADLPTLQSQWQQVVNTLMPLYTQQINTMQSQLMALAPSYQPIIPSGDVGTLQAQYQTINTALQNAQNAAYNSEAAAIAAETNTTSITPNASNPGVPYNYHYATGVVPGVSAPTSSSFLGTGLSMETILLIAAGGAMLYFFAQDKGATRSYHRHTSNTLKQNPAKHNKKITPAFRKRMIEKLEEQKSKRKMDKWRSRTDNFFDLPFSK